MVEWINQLTARQLTEADCHHPFFHPTTFLDTTTTISPTNISLFACLWLRRFIHLPCHPHRIPAANLRRALCFEIKASS